MASRVWSIDVTGAIRNVLAWWIGELQDLCPPRIRRALSGELITIAVSMSQEAVQVTTENRLTGRVTVAQTSATDATRTWAHVRANVVKLAKRFGPFGAVRLRIAPDQCHERVIETPTSDRTQINAIGMIDLERGTPFNLQSIYVGHGRIEGRAQRADSPLRAVPQIIVKRGLVDAVRDDLWRAGVAVAAVEAVNDQKTWRSIEITQGLAPRHRTLLKALTPAIVILSLCAGALAIYRTAAALGQQQASLTDIDAALGQARLRLSKLQQDAAQHSTRSALLRAPALEKMTTQSVLDVWLDLTKRLSDDTWLESLVIGPDGIDITGTSPAASDQVPILSKSPHVQSVTFAAPVFRDAAARERFQITMKRSVSDVSIRPLPALAPARQP